eukprot:jgi/Phyca11/133405/e_gw1.446.2.1
MFVGLAVFCALVARVSACPFTGSRPPLALVDTLVTSRAAVGRSLLAFSSLELLVSRPGLRPSSRTLSVLFTTARGSSLVLLQPLGVTLRSPPASYSALWVVVTANWSVGSCSSTGSPSPKFRSESFPRGVSPCSLSPSATVPPVVALVESAALVCAFRRPFRLLPAAARTVYTNGARDNASATTFVFPGRYSTSKSYSCRVNAQRCSFPVRFELVINHFSAA